MKKPVNYDSDAEEKIPPKSSKGKVVDDDDNDEEAKEHESL